MEEHQPSAHNSNFTQSQRFYYSQPQATDSLQALMTDPIISDPSISNSFHRRLSAARLELQVPSPRRVRPTPSYFRPLSSFEPLPGDFVTQSFIPTPGTSTPVRPAAREIPVVDMSHRMTLRSLAHRVSSSAAVSGAAAPVPSAVTSHPAVAAAASSPPQHGMPESISVSQTNSTSGRSRKRRASEMLAAAEATTLPSKRRSRCSTSRATKKVSSVTNSGNSIDETDEKEDSLEADSCCICMSDMEPDEAASINGCDHRFCFGCIEKWSERENTCPLCKMRFTKIDRVNKRRKKGTKNTKKVKQRDQRSDLAPGAALEGLLANLSRGSPFPSHSIARLIFSGVGTGLFELNGRAMRARSDALNLPGIGDFSSDDDDGDENPFSGFFRTVNGSSVVMGGGMQVVRPVSFAAHAHPERSYAINSNDQNAGRGLENPLEIEDDSDDEEVEILQVMPPST